MATVMEFREFKAYLDGLRGAIARGKAIAMLDAVTLASGLAKQNLQQRANTYGIEDYGYKKTGALMNSIYGGFERDGEDVTGFVGVRSNKGRALPGGDSTRPYGRAQEYGATIRPVKAKWLWVKHWLNVPNELRWITPTEFFRRKRANPAAFALVPRERGRGFVAMYYALGGRKGAEGVPLFTLVDEVNLPARPYVTPAVAVVGQKVPALISKRIAEQMK